MPRMSMRTSEALSLWMWDNHERLVKDDLTFVEACRQFSAWHKGRMSAGVWAMKAARDRHEAEMSRHGKPVRRKWTGRRYNRKRSVSR